MQRRVDIEGARNLVADEVQRFARKLESELTLPRGHAFHLDGRGTGMGLRQVLTWCQGCPVQSTLSGASIAAYPDQDVPPAIGVRVEARFFWSSIAVKRRGGDVVLRAGEDRPRAIVWVGQGENVVGQWRDLMDAAGVVRFVEGRSPEEVAEAAARAIQGALGAAAEGVASSGGIGPERGQSERQAAAQA